MVVVHKVGINMYTTVYLCVNDCGEDNTLLYTPEWCSREECIEYGIAQSRSQ